VRVVVLPTAAGLSPQGQWIRENCHCANGVQHLQWSRMLVFRPGAEYAVDLRELIGGDDQTIGSDVLLETIRTSVIRLHRQSWIFVVATAPVSTVRTPRLSRPCNDHFDTRRSTPVRTRSPQLGNAELAHRFARIVWRSSLAGRGESHCDNRSSNRNNLAR
jgi:hypothetical protein